MFCIVAVTLRAKRTFLRHSYLYKKLPPLDVFMQNVDTFAAKLSNG